MYTCALFLGLAALSKANPFPQAIDYAAVAAAGPIPSPSIAVGVASQVVTYNAKSAAGSATAQISAKPLSGKVQKRDGNCAPQPTGAGPIPSPDTASAFLAYQAFASVASAAAVPSGYNPAFVNLQASNNANGYMGFVTLPTYDSNVCAAKCNAISGCSAINIYFERDPTVDPGAACPNPSSTTAIKCVFWGGPVTVANAVNTGQNRSSFQVVIAGSNGYTLSVAASPTTPGLPNVSTYVKQGCFGGGVLSGRVSGNSNINTLEYCAAYCQDFLYFSVENGNSCSCGNTPSNTNPSTSCHTQCYGNSTEICGGFGAQDTYMRPAAPIVPKPTVPMVQGFTLLSCISGVSLNGSHVSGSGVSVETCAAKCAAFSYFEVQNGNYCGCGNTLAGNQVTPGCNTPCAGNSTEFCGGFGQSNVYYKL